MSVFRVCNFCVRKDAENFYGVYRCTVSGKPCGSLLTSDTSFSRALKKARLLEKGYAECQMDSCDYY